MQVLWLLNDTSLSEDGVNVSVSERKLVFNLLSAQSLIGSEGSPNKTGWAIATGACGIACSHIAGRRVHGDVVIFLLFQ